MLHAMVFYECMDIFAITHAEATDSIPAHASAQAACIDHFLGFVMQVMLRVAGDLDTHVRFYNEVC